MPLIMEYILLSPYFRPVMPSSRTRQIHRHRQLENDRTGCAECARVEKWITSIRLRNGPTHGRYFSAFQLR